MKDFSTIVVPLNELTKKCVPFVWGVAQDLAFDELKRLLTCWDPGLAYVIPVTMQSHGEPRSVPTCLSRQGQAQHALGKHQTSGASHLGRMIN